MRFLKLITRGSTWLFRLFYLLLAVVVILGAAYALGGYEFLAKGFWGSDMKSALAMLAWVDKYFPHVPFWYPLAGGGVSITHSYPAFSFYLVAILQRVTDLNLIQAFGVLGVSSVFLMALGTYAFVALRFKNQTAALIASVFYLVSPIAWTWLIDWGFYAEVVSHIFVAPAIIFWDLFFTSFLEDPMRVKNRIYLALAVIFLSLALLTHFGTGFGLVGLFGFYILGYVLKTKERKKVFARGVLALSLVGVLTLLATAFATFPLSRYSKIAAQAGLTGYISYEQVKEGELSLNHVLSLQPAVVFDEQFGNYFSATRHVSFPVVVAFFAGLGILLSLLSARNLTLALFSIFALTLSLNANFFFWVLHHIPWPFYAPFGWRWTFIPLRVVLPALAALGAVGVFKVPFFWVRGGIVGFIKGVFASLAGLALAAFALYQFGHLPKPEGFPLNYGARGFDLRNIWNKDFCFPDSLGECTIKIGQDSCLAENQSLYLEHAKNVQVFEEENGEWCHSPLRSYFLPIPTRDWCQRAKGGGEVLPELCDLGQLTDGKVKVFWQKCKEDGSFSKLCSLRFKSLEEQLSLSSWPEFKIISFFEQEQDPKTEQGKMIAVFKQILEEISKENPYARIDFSPWSSGQAMTFPYHSLDRNLSQLYIYVADSSLIHRFWGQQIGAFYLDDPFYGKDSSFVSEWARWFGINYVSFEGHTNPQRFQEGGWEVFDGSWKSGVLKFPEENSLTDLSQKPAVLIIGQNSVDAYGQVFRLASRGILPYKDAFVVWGRERVDDYSLEELQDFDTLLLHGYTYENPQKTNKILADYVKAGGKVFIDTGWQYTVPDWETENALEIIPFEKLSWKDLGKTSDFVLEDSELGGGVDVSKFAPLIYYGQPWGVSTGERSDLRDWAKVVLSVKDYPLVAVGELGEGRVVWSGMNIFAHAKQKEAIYHEEIKLLTNLFAWLNGGASSDNFAVSYKRDHPDKAEFTIEEDVSNGGFLLWKEAYHPDFHATLSSTLNPQPSNLDIYRAGPGWALIKVPELKEGDKIIYEYRKPFSETAASAVSLSTFAFILPFLIVDGFRKEKSWFAKFIIWSEKKLEFLFFDLVKKPFTWWGKKDEDAY